MKPTTINVQITRNPRQYEAVRLGLEASLDAGETIDTAIKVATAQLNCIYEEMYVNVQKAPQTPQKPATNGTQAKPAEPSKPKEPEEPEKPKPLKFGDPLLQQIVHRIEAAAGNADKLAKLRENINKYYVPDAEAQKVIDLTFGLNN